METKNIILKLRTERGMSQDELADKIMVTRQAVSRWENGDTVPNTDTLKLLSKEFDVSINTLLGEPRKLICQCCGMPIDDDSILGRDKDGTLNEEYCKWCYADGTYTYNDMDELIDVCVKNMVNENFTEEQARSYLKEMLPKLDYWKRYDELSDNGQFEEFKKQLINEINDLHIDGLPRVDKLNALVGKYVNLEYTLPNGQKVKFLDDQKTYLGNQLESEFRAERCFGILANMDFILVSNDMKEMAKANAGSFANPHKMVVLIDEEKIERMATDEQYRKQYESVIASAQNKLPELKQSLGNSANIKGFGMQVNDNGASSFFAVMDKSFKAQADRLEKQRAEKKEEKKAARKKAEKKEREEQLEEKRLKNKDSQEVVITANSIEELKKKIDDYNYLQMADTVKTDAEKYLGRTIDFKG